MKCLVIQTAYLGDVILTLPLLSLLRGMPDLASLAVLTTPAGAAFLRTQDAVDRIIVYDKRGADGGAKGFLRVVSDLKRCGFGLAVIPHRSFRSALLALLALIPDRVGFDESGGRFLLTRRVPYRSRPHEMERMGALAAAAGAATPEGRLDFRILVPARGNSELSAALDSRGIGGSERLVVAAPGSRWATKRWDAARFGLAMAALADDPGLRPVVAGAEADSLPGAAAAAAAGERAVDLTGALSLRGWIALMSRASVVLSNDSAAAHVAAGVGTPVVAVFGPTVPGQGFAPYSDSARVVEAGVGCRPCGRHGSDACRLRTMECMDRVGVADVVAAARSALEEARP